MAGRNAHAGEHPAAPECNTADLLAGRMPSAQEEVNGSAALVTDGAVAPEGALWDAPAAVKLASRSASITYDLGEPRKVSALFLQADANDTYKIAGSIDGQPGSFRALAEVANVVDRGPGLRIRSVQIEPVMVRYLRIGEANGDGSYSVSEFAAYCLAPTPFPPVMRTVDAPLAASPQFPAEPGMAEPARSAPIGWLEILLAVAIVSLAGVQIARRKRRRGAPPAPSSADERPFALLLVLFVASGCAALIYEVVWFQMLQLVLGSSAVSIGVLLGTFMGGMCLGLACLRHPRNRDRCFRDLDAGGDTAGPVCLHGRGRARRPGAALARLVRGDLSSAADRDDGGHAARGFALGGNEPAGRLVARDLLCRQHARGSVWLSACGLLSSPSSRHAHRDLRRRRLERGGRRGRARARADPSRGRATGHQSRSAGPRDHGSDDTRLDHLSGDRAFGDERAGRRGDLDAALRAALEPHHVYLLDHPGRVLDRDRAGKWRWLVAGTSDVQCVPGARLCAACAGRGDRLGVVEHHQLAALLARQSAAGGQSLESIPDRFCPLPLGDPARGLPVGCQLSPGACGGRV